MKGIFLLVVIVIWIVRAISENTGSSRGRDRGGGRAPRFRVRIKPDTIEDGGSTFAIWRVFMNGPIVVPRARYPVRVQVRVVDETTKDERFAVYCRLPDLADEEGLFLAQTDSKIPHAESVVQNAEIAVVPVFALLGPHQGTRKFRIYVDIVDQRNEERVFQSASKIESFEQTEHGYMEFEQRSEQQEMLIGKLALAFCASDGTIDRTETAVIQSYFRERLAAREADADARKRLSDMLKETRTTLVSGSVKSAALITETCGEILEFDSPDYHQSAYELCVRVVAADDVVDTQETKALAQLAKLLHIPADFAKEAHDRNFRLSMYGHKQDESLLDMPEGLSHAEKIAFLNREYKKWRARATHDDESVREEATRRLELITKLRRELTANQ